jgi:hypothetical protein
MAQVRQEYKPKLGAPKSTGTNPVLLHVEIVRKELRKHGGVMSLSLSSPARRRWANRGMTLKQRDYAAKLLVQWDEAVYADRSYHNGPDQGEGICLVSRELLDYEAGL